MLSPNIAFKEWAPIVEAIAAGQQKIILRKGGISESEGEFKPEHSQFWLFPTWFHQQQQDGLKNTAVIWLSLAESKKPVAGLIPIQHLVTVNHVEKITNWDDVVKLDTEHFWTVETVKKRFFYREPGLYVFRISVQSLPNAVMLKDDPFYAGCKSWVPLKIS